MSASVRNDVGVAHLARLRRPGVLSLVLALVLTGTAAPSHADEPTPAAAGSKAPNVVLIFADDVGWGDIGFNGRTSWATPHLDRLAAQGLKLNRFYTGAVVCAPSRAVLLTGRYTIHNGVSRNDADLPASEVTLAEALRARGYETALFGKWHHGKPRAGQADWTHPLDQGFDQTFGFLDAVHAWEKFPEFLWQGRERVPAVGYADDRFTERAVAYIEGHARAERPFFLYLPLISGHFHIQAPAEEVARHRGRFPEDADSPTPLRATYAAMITRLDAHVGQVMAALDRAGLTENTLVLFTSDHGATFESGNKGTSAYHDSNAPLRGQKRTLWEGGIRVPACVRWPGRIAPGSVSEQPMHTIDVFPTVLAAAGGAPAQAPESPPAPTLDGVNLLPAWTSPAPALALDTRPLFWEWRSEGAEQRAALQGDYKLVSTRGGAPELFHLPSDPAERRNIAATEPERVRALNQALRAWLATEIDQP